jgi:protein-S-isoprenylcysteine O-methyltransferase Ste14
MFDALRSREAQTDNPRWNLVKTLGQSAVFWILTLFVFPALIVRGENALGLDAYQFPMPALKVVGGVLFALGGSLGIWSGTLFALLGRGTPLPADCTRRLVIAGPYRYVRNPMAIGGLIQGYAVGLYLGSPTVLFYVLAGMIFWNYFMRRWEEADLEQRFGEPFRNYRRAVRCWIPRLRPYQNGGDSDDADTKKS